jgi:hypothetical protein
MSIYPKPSTNNVSYPAIKAPPIYKSAEKSKLEFGVFPNITQLTMIVATTAHLLNVRNRGILTNLTENKPNSTCTFYMLAKVKPAFSFWKSSGHVDIFKPIFAKAWNALLSTKVL